METTCNTHTTATFDGPPGIAAIDHLTLRLNVAWSDWKGLQPVLSEAKQRASMRGDDPSLDQVILAGVACEAKANGQRWGGANAATFFPYVIVLPDGTRICFRDASRSRGKMPDVQVSIPGRTCLLHGAEFSRVNALEFLNALGATITEEHLARIDLCVDLVDVDMSAIEETWLDKAISYGKCGRWSNQGTVGFGAKESGRRLQMYDKRVELKQKKDSLIYQAMVERRWHGVEPEHAVRLEFQLYPNVLRHWGVSSYSDFEAVRGDLVERLTQNLMVTPDHPGVASVIKRATEALQIWAGQPTGVPLEPITPTSIDTQADLRRAMGNLARVAAKEGYTFQSNQDIVVFILEVAERALANYPFLRKVERAKKASSFNDTTITSALEGWPNW